MTPAEFLAQSCLLYTSTATDKYGVEFALAGSLKFQTVLTPAEAKAAFLAVSYTHLDVYKRQANVNAKDPVDVADAILILRKIVGLLDIFPAQEKLNEAEAAVIKAEGSLLQEDVNSARILVEARCV